MCAAAIRWSGFKELIYGTSAAKLADCEHARVGGARCRQERVWLTSVGLDHIPLAGLAVWEASYIFAHGTRR
jgi:hypothetical protein